MTKILVTGGAGFIGSNIVDELVRMGHEVRVIDSFITGNMENLKAVRKKIDLVKGDIRDLALMRKAAKGAAFVLHQAAYRSVPKSVDNPSLTNDINITGTLNALIAAKDARVKRFVYASSSSCYGDAKRFPQKEEHLPDPISPYAVSKLSGEYYCKTFSATFGLDTVSLRYFNVFGPRQNPESKYSTVVPAFIFRMMRDLEPVVEGDGGQSRDFTFVKNVVDANIKAAFSKRRFSGQVINVACGRSYSILELVASLNNLMEKSIKPRFGPARLGDVRKTHADITKLKKILKLEPKVGFEEGLKETLNWFRENKVELQ